MFELPPHLYAVANEAYYQMKEETSDQVSRVLVFETMKNMTRGPAIARKQITSFKCCIENLILVRDHGLAHVASMHLLSAQPVISSVHALKLSSLLSCARVFSAS